jgi:hypothetical protein
MSEYDMKARIRAWRATSVAGAVVPVDEGMESSVKLA